MSYFKDFPKEFYRFANGDQALMQNLSLYVDVVDQVKVNSAFYENYFIQDGDRPDNVAYTLYKNPQLHWTLYIMNDSLREKGWPLSKRRIVEKAKEDFPYVTLNTHDNIGMFLKDMVVRGTVSGARGRVVYTDTSLGQVTVEPVESPVTVMIDGEPTIQYQILDFIADDIILDVDGDISQSANLRSVEKEYLSAHHYTMSGEIVDYRTKSGWNDLAVEVSKLEHYQLENDALREIRIIKPNSISAVVGVFNKAVRS